MNEKLPGLFLCNVRPMTQDESKLFLTITMMENKGGDALKDVDKTLREKEVFPYMVMVSRLEAFKQAFSPTLDIGIGPQVFCALVSDRPGKVVMWAHTLNEIFVRLGRQINLSDWTFERLRRLYRAFQGHPRHPGGWSSARTTAGIVG